MASLGESELAMLGSRILGVGVFRAFVRPLVSQLITRAKVGVVMNSLTGKFDRST